MTSQSERPGRLGDKARRDSEQQMRLFVELAPAAVAMFDGEMRYLMVSRRWLADHGLGNRDVVGLSQYDVFPETAPRWREIHRRALGGETIRCDEDSFVRADGLTEWIRWEICPWHRTDGEIGGVILFTEVITSQKQTEQSLYESEERMRAILATAVDTVVTINRQGIIDGVNPTVEPMFGYTPEEVTGKNVSILMPSPYREEHDGYLARYLNTRDPRIIGIGREVVGQRKDGSTFPVDLAVSEIEHLGLFTGIIRDISDRVETRNRLLQNARLAALGEAMACMAHESRNALQRSQVYLDLLTKQHSEDRESLECLNSMQKALDDLNCLYERVRSYAAPIQLTLQMLDVGSLLRQVWSEVQSAFATCQMRLTERAECEDLCCRVDSFALGQVFRNILENAIQASGEPVEIQVVYSRHSRDNGRELVIAIRDNGPGLTAEQQKRVFDSFYTTKSRGTGLGMAIAQRIVEAHGGKIVLNPACPKGAEFVVCMPTEGRNSTGRH